MEEHYQKMFCRNIGIITDQEQEKLSQTTIGVAGTGGVAGTALLNLVRIGVGGFNIADPEAFDYPDINRQQGSSLEAVGSKKVVVLEQVLKSINPYVSVRTYPEGLTEGNMQSFLEGTSLVIDGLDFFCLGIRKRLLDESRKRGLYVLGCPILGFGTSLAVFAPDGPGFDDFFGPLPKVVDGKYAVNFGRSYFPKLPKYIDLAAYFEAMKKNKPIPSFATSCALSGTVTAAEAIFILLNKRKPVCVPYVRQYDLFEGKITVRDGRKKKLSWIRKSILKMVLKRRKKWDAYKDLLDSL